MNCDRRQRYGNNIRAWNLASWKSCAKKCENVELKCFTNGGRKKQWSDWMGYYLHD